MLSIIISSVRTDHLELIKSNIKSTIGVPYEIVAIDNSNAEMGLCEVYNTGARKAKFGLLCFMHEDIRIMTDQWGKKVIDHFEKDEKLGLLGVVGSSYKSSVFSGWAPYGATPKTIDYANLIQSFKYQDIPSYHYYSNPNNLLIQEVAVLDGVWLCTKKEIIQKFSFDENTFKGFHCYDLDISLSISREYKIAVVYDVLLEHFSEGKFEREWANATFDLHKKWKNYLPLNRDNLNRKEMIYIEKKFFRHGVVELAKMKYTKWEILRTLNNSKVKKLDVLLYLKLYLATMMK